MTSKRTPKVCQCGVDADVAVGRALEGCSGVRSREDLAGLLQGRLTVMGLLSEPESGAS